MDPYKLGKNFIENGMFIHALLCVKCVLFVLHISKRHKKQVFSGSKSDNYCIF